MKIFSYFCWEILYENFKIINHEESKCNFYRAYFDLIICWG